MHISEHKKQDLEKQGYRLVGNHSAIKVCHWVKRALRNEDVCYKKTFYGINTCRCVQMTPSLPFCNQRCSWCWRDIGFTSAEWSGPIDSPKEIVDGCIKEQVKYLQGFGGNSSVDKDKYKAAQKPLHFAISLSGEPTLYPKLPELIQEIHTQGMTTFLVTNGTHPNMIKELINNQPTQLYMTLPAPNTEIYEKVCEPLTPNNWQKILQTLSLLKHFKRSVIRLTLAKGINMVSAKDYAQLIANNPATFIELKAYMWVGYSRQRLGIENMPRHSEIIEFAHEIIKHCPELKIIDEKKESRVVLLAENDPKDRILAKI